MMCRRCQGARVLIACTTRAIVACPDCEGSGSADATDLAGISMAEGGIARPSRQPAQETAYGH